MKILGQQMWPKVWTIAESYTVVKLLCRSVLRKDKTLCDICIVCLCICVCVSPIVFASWSSAQFRVNFREETRAGSVRRESEDSSDVLMEA